jgi:hypothetical protein
VEGTVRWRALDRRAEGCDGEPQSGKEARSSVAPTPAAVIHLTGQNVGAVRTMTRRGRLGRQCGSWALQPPQDPQVVTQHNDLQVSVIDATRSSIRKPRTRGIKKKREVGRSLTDSQASRQRRTSKARASSLYPTGRRLRHCGPAADHRRPRSGTLRYISSPMTSARSWVDQPTILAARPTMATSRCLPARS